MTHLIRPVDEERDFPELAAMLDQVMTQGMTVAQLRTGAKSPAPLNRNMVALNDEGAIVGWSLLRRSENEPESRAFTSIIAHPDSRRNGIGSALLDDVVTHARSIGVTALKSRVKDSEPGWLVWAKLKGFEIDHHQFRSSVKLSEFDDTPFVGRVTELEAAGIVFTTLAELGDTDENRRRYYEVDFKAAQDIPGEDYIESWPEYEVIVFGNEEYRPDGAFLALDGDQRADEAALDAAGKRRAEPHQPKHPRRKAAIGRVLVDGAEGELVVPVEARRHERELSEAGAVASGGDEKRPGADDAQQCAE
ncbi:MAG: GNAT family N-acetyltransferase, partial [Chloroflexi bacterium]|nr:GNAT family N-acetyltransferase [Chloroflexota bacterium]